MPYYFFQSDEKSFVFLKNALNFLSKKAQLVNDFFYVQKVSAFGLTSYVQLTCKDMTFNIGIMAHHHIPKLRKYEETFLCSARELSSHYTWFGFPPPTQYVDVSL
jgi:hypothetical protein